MPSTISDVEQSGTSDSSTDEFLQVLSAMVAVLCPSHQTDHGTTDPKLSTFQSGSVSQSGAAQQQLLDQASLILSAGEISTHSAEVEWGDFGSGIIAEANLPENVAAFELPVASDTSHSDLDETLQSLEFDLTSLDETGSLTDTSELTRVEFSTADLTEFQASNPVERPLHPGKGGELSTAFSRPDGVHIEAVEDVLTTAAIDGSIESEAAGEASALRGGSGEPDAATDLSGPGEARFALQHGESRLTEPGEAVTVEELPKVLKSSLPGPDQRERRLTLRLDPPELGSLSVTITSRTSGLHIHISARAEAVSSIQSKLAELRDALADQSVQLSQIEVTSDLLENTYSQNQRRQTGFLPSPEHEHVPDESGPFNSITGRSVSVTSSRTAQTRGYLA